MKYIVLLALLGLFAETEAIQLDSMIRLAKEEEKKAPEPEEKKIQDDPTPDTGVKNVKVPGKTAAEKQAEKDDSETKAKEAKEAPKEKPKTPEEIELEKKAALVDKEKALMEENKAKAEAEKQHDIVAPAVAGSESEQFDRYMKGSYERDMAETTKLDVKT